MPGTPGQQFTVVLDTGSSTLWIPDYTCSGDKKCASDCYKDQSFCSYSCDDYCCAGFSTSSSEDLSTTGGSGSSSCEDCIINSEQSTDYFASHMDISLKNQTPRKIPISSCDKKVKFNSNLSSTYSKNGEKFEINYGVGFAKGFLGSDVVRIGNTDGDELVIPNTVFGQATSISKDFRDDVVDGILGLAYSQLAVDNVVPPIVNAIRQNLLNQSLFTVYLETQGIDTVDRKGGVFTYGAVDTVNCGSVIGYVPLSSDTYYQFSIEGVNVGTRYSKLRRYDAISDTGTSLIYGPTQIVKRIAKSVGAKDQGGYYTLNCIKQYEPVTFTIAGQQYNLTSKVLTMQIGMEYQQCLFAMMGMEAAGQSFDWLLGDPFIRQFCNIYDIGQSRIGFAAARKSS